MGLRKRDGVYCRTWWPRVYGRREEVGTSIFLPFTGEQLTKGLQDSYTFQAQDLTRSGVLMAEHVHR